LRAILRGDVGESRIPGEWVERLARRDMIEGALAGLGAAAK